jgi:hypothetical protein
LHPNLKYWKANALNLPVTFKFEDMLAPPPCDLDSIAPYVPTVDKPWDEQRAKHLYRRLGFGTDLATIQAAILQDPLTLIDNLVDAAITLPTTPAPAWGNWALADYNDVEVEAPQQVLDWYAQFINDMLDNGLRDKLTLFWSNHFVTQLNAYECPSYMFQYYNLLQTHGLGNFQDFTHAMGITPAMIVYLNAYQNTAASPNENYARELFELFTLGENNGYNQTDIVETAKALTGYNGFTDFCAPITFDDLSHSHADKTIFGQTGDWDYDDVISIIFAQRGAEVAQHICNKLYTYFASPEPDQAIIDEMASTFISNNFEIAPVLKQLFKSEHFFDDDLVGVKIKSPMEVILSTIKDGNFSYDDNVIEAARYYGGLLGQEIFDPVDVAGWQGNHTWINTSTITGRWLIIDDYMLWLYDNHPEELRSLAIDLVGGVSSDPALITQKIVDYFTPKGLLTASEYSQATTVFKWEYPQNYYDLGIWSLNDEYAPAQVAFLLIHISHMPEFQLT